MHPPGSDVAGQLEPIHGASAAVPLSAGCEQSGRYGLTIALVVAEFESPALSVTVSVTA